MTHSHPPGTDEPRIRVAALERLLTDLGLIVPSRVDRIIERYAEEIGPLNGARVVAKAWTDPEFRARLLREGTSAVAELGFEGAQMDRLVVCANDPKTHNVVCCTLCSCYPWALLGLPPAWYKSAAYRARIVREPRAVLAELGLQLDDDVEIRVWDSSAEVRYMVLPERPPESEGLGEAQLVDWVSREALIGVQRVLTAPETGHA